jgi:hypothetical protein
MQVKVTEEFYRKRSYTHRYDHLLNVKWSAITLLCNPPKYYIYYQDIKEVVTEEEIVRVN